MALSKTVTVPSSPESGPQPIPLFENSNNPSSNMDYNTSHRIPFPGFSHFSRIHESSPLLKRLSIHVKPTALHHDDKLGKDTYTNTPRHIKGNDMDGPASSSSNVICETVCMLSPPYHNPRDDPDTQDMSNNSSEADSMDSMLLCDGDLYKVKEAVPSILDCYVLVHFLPTFLLSA